MPIVLRDVSRGRCYDGYRPDLGGWLDAGPGEAGPRPTAGQPLPAGRGAAEPGRGDGLRHRARRGATFVDSRAPAMVVPASVRPRDPGRLTRHRRGGLIVQDM